MALPAITPLSGLSGSGAAEWTIPSVDGAPAAAGSGGFGGMLGKAISSLESTQQAATTASSQLVAGTASDPSAVVVAVERARLAMQLAAQMRTKGVEAVNEVFHTQV